MIILNNHHSKSNILGFKRVNPVFLRFLIIVCNTLLVASYSHAGTYYWDSNGINSGFGVASGTWTTPTTNQWNTNINGTSTLQVNPTGKFGTPEEVANGVVFLSSPVASRISGTNLVIDGALTVAV